MTITEPTEVVSISIEMLYALYILNGLLLGGILGWLVGYSMAENIMAKR